MKCSKSLQKYGTIDISRLLDCTINQTEDDWSANEYRQQRFLVHNDTQTIYLIFDDDFRHLEATRRPKFEVFASALHPLIAQIASYFNYQGWVIRCILTRLKAGGRIAPHSDRGFSLMHAHRFHVPIITNENVLFTVGDDTVHMQSGEIWEIDNSLLHTVVNLGGEDRVHLILDWAEPMTHANIRAYEVSRQRQEAERRAGISQKYD